MSRFRVAVGVTAVVSWFVAVALFGGYAVASRISLNRECWFFGWMVSILAFRLLAKIMASTTI